jgi:transposase-like protein
VSKKKGIKKVYSKAFREMAMGRLRGCENVTVLARELGVDRTLLYKWRERMEKRGQSIASGERKLRGEILELQRLLAQKSLEADFFKGALQKVEARRQSKDTSGAKASTTKSGS